MDSISLFFPAYNDSLTIARLISDALAVLPSLTDDYEVIVVNDGSTDETASVLDEIARRTPGLKVIHHENNKGYGGALRSGFRAASKELVFYTDGDGQYDVRELLALRPLLKPGVDVVNGYKKRRADGGRRRLLGAAYNHLAHLLFSLPVRDVDCDFRLLRRSALNRVALSSSSGVICVELVYKLHRAGCSFAEIPVSHYPRLYGRSQFFTLARVARTVFDLFSLWLQLVVLPRLPRRAAASAARARRTASEADVK
ncbi:MAG TPA: glycosyltransferase family 2 protein [Pyrinomonadaceae bacterium]|jgi:glycosyltransferase involved in cell wall biosynthesis